jgi:hypothetical protein
LSIAIEAPDDDGGDNITHYNVQVFGNVGCNHNSVQNSGIYQVGLNQTYVEVLTSTGEFGTVSVFFFLHPFGFSWFLVVSRVTRHID